MVRGIFAAFLVTAVLTAAGSYGSITQTSCVSCHSAVSQGDRNPTELWGKDLHRRSGIGCHDCHGGDPTQYERAMSPAAGFKGPLDKAASNRLCGQCHADPERIPDPTLRTDQLPLLESGPHGEKGKAGTPGCVFCHGSHGMLRTTDPSSRVFRSRTPTICRPCHEEQAAKFSGDVHGRAFIEAINPRSPACTDCHGAHRSLALSEENTLVVCGNCHTLELDYFQAGPHGASLLKTGQPSCTQCHGYHGIRSTGLEEIVGRITENCERCHQVNTDALLFAVKIDQELGVAWSFLGSLEDHSRELKLAGVETGEMDRLDREAYGWLMQVETAIHSVDSDWEELTGMAKVKMIAAWDLARDYSLERGIRRIIFLLLSLAACFLLALVVYKIKLIDRDARRRHLLGSPEARQREQGLGKK